MPETNTTYITTGCVFCGHSLKASEAVDTRFGMVHDDCIADAQNSYDD